MKGVEMSEKIEYGLVLEREEPLDKLRPVVEAALKDEGFGVLTEIDVKATLKKKLDVDVPDQVILGACNPPLAHRAMETEPDIGLLLPCNVVLRGLPDGRTRVTAMNVRRVMAVVDNPALADVAGEVDERLRRVMKKLGT
jgi:uncharacterized protein (DUF302 family)